MKETYIKLKPTGIFKENLRSYYTVSYNDDEYNVKMWQFQIDKGGLPDELDCIVKEANGTIKIVQDQATIINELYEVGKTYRFRIKQKYKDFYSVIESNGLIFRLVEFGSKPLFEGQSINAEVISISTKLTCLRLKDDDPDSSLPFKTIQQICSEIGLDEEAEKLLSQLGLTAGFRETKQLYDSQDGKWVMDAAMRLDEYILSQDDIDVDNGLVYVRALDRLCHYILEESNMMTRIKGDERRLWLQRLTSVVQHAEDYRQAFSILKQGTEREYVLRQLSFLQESENLYEPERKFRIIMCIFGMREQLMTELMPRIFEIILGGNKEYWSAEPFRTAFVNMLELFVTEYRHRAMRNSATGLIPKLITAIAIQQLLSTGDDDIDRRLNRTTYLRLLACTERYASEGILEDAFYSLFTPYNPDVQYDWKSIEVLDSLYMRAAYSMKHPDARSMSTQVFRTDKVELLITPERMVLQPLEGRPKSILPSGLMPWHKLDIRANSSPVIKDKRRDDIAYLDLLWKDIRDCLFSESKINASAIKISPSKGDLVRIKVIDLAEDYSALYCEIDDDEYQGHGWLDLKEIVKYINGSDTLLDFFRDERGRPLLLEAEVKCEANDQGELEFSMLHVVQEYALSVHEPGDVIRCNIRKMGADRCHYVCVSDFGTSCRVAFDPDLEMGLQPGDIVEARINGMNKYGQFVCDYTADVEYPFSIASAFRSLLHNLSFPYDDDDEIDYNDELEEMSKAEVYEIICILDRMAVLSDTHSRTFSFLSLCGLLCEIIGDEQSVDYYEKRKRLVKIFSDYERNGAVDGAELEKLVQSIDDELLGSDYLMNESLTKIRILDSLKHKDNVDKLYAIRRSSHNPQIRNAADMAVALLLTSRFEIPNMQRQLEDRICKELGVKLRISKLKDYGFETQTLEFKSSIIYPADNNMQPSPELQGAVIMQTLCGFLNSDSGGVLYLGVNKNGAACGVDDDMRYLHADEDAYGRYVHGLINRELGQIANQCCIDCTWESDGGYRVYKMNIQPSPELIAFRGQYWIRQDTEKRPLAKDKIETYRKMHEAAYAKSHRP